MRLSFFTLAEMDTRCFASSTTTTCSPPSGVPGSEGASGLGGGSRSMAAPGIGTRHHPIRIVMGPEAGIRQTPPRLFTAASPWEERARREAALGEDRRAFERPALDFRSIKAL